MKEQISVKRVYETPAIEVVEIQNQGAILMDSPGGGSGSQTGFPGFDDDEE